MDFVEGAVLESTDGVSHAKETILEPKPDEERTYVRPERSGLSLADQLKLNKEIADEEWKAKHNPFKPPPAMTEEEYDEMVEGLEAERTVRRQETQRSQQDLAAYEQAVLQNRSKIVVEAAEPSEKLGGLGSFAALAAEKKRRQAAEAEAAAKQAKQEPKVQVKVKKAGKRKGDEAKDDKKKHKKQKKKAGDDDGNNGGLSGLVGAYGSGDDSD